MGGLAWVKSQDFYLRLGFLKALVSVLNPQRRSATNDAIYRRLRDPLFESARDHKGLWTRVGHRIDWYKPTGRSADVRSGRTGATHVEPAAPTIAEALLVAGDCPSLLFAVTEPTVYKILDWGHNIGFVGRGNQITERGLLLRSLLPADDVERFFAGDPEAWNPFVLTQKERLFLLFHIGEIDRLTAELITDIGAWNGGDFLESADAARLTCVALVRVLEQAKDEVAPRDLPAYRTAQELVYVIGSELDVDTKIGFEHAVRSKRPRPMKPGANRSTLFRQGGGTPRKTTKNSDHQTIPRCEQLVDLGLLEKPGDGGDDSQGLRSRRRWRYAATSACKKWATISPRLSSDAEPFWWNGFAAAVVNAFELRPARHVVDRVEALGQYLWDAYEAVCRPIGHTPLDSVVLLAMIQAATDGVAIEMGEFHRIMLAVKQQSAMPDHAFFASGNDLDKMFIHLKPGFLERLRVVAPELGG